MIEAYFTVKYYMALAGLALGVVGLIVLIVHAIFRR